MDSYVHRIDNKINLDDHDVGFVYSVTQGCFESYRETNGEIETYFEQNYAYHRYVQRILAMFYPKVSVNITELLSNKINHPTHEMNWIFAYSLVEEIMKLY